MEALPLASVFNGDDEQLTGAPLLKSILRTARLEITTIFEQVSRPLSAVEEEAMLDDVHVWLERCKLAYTAVYHVKFESLLQLEELRPPLNWQSIVELHERIGCVFPSHLSLAQTEFRDHMSAIGTEVRVSTAV